MKFKRWFREYIYFQRIKGGMIMRFCQHLFMIRSFLFPDVLAISMENRQGFQWELHMPAFTIFSRKDLSKAIRK